MDKFDYSENASVLTILINSCDPTSLITPEDFKDKVITIFENGIQVEITNLNNIQYNHQSCDGLCGNTCSQCLLLCTLSAVESLFKFIEERIMCKMDGCGKVNSASVFTEDPAKLVKDNSQCSKHQEESVAAVEYWYQEATKLLCTNNFTDLLVKCLLCGRKFTSFLARKALLSGIFTHHIKTSEVLKLLKLHWHGGLQFCLPLLEVFAAMMSQNRFPGKQVNDQTFSCLQEMELTSFIETKIDKNTKGFYDTKGLLEYLYLLHKVIKYGMCRCDSEEFRDIFFVNQIVEKILLLYGDYFFSVGKYDKGHLICLEFLKCINTFLDIRLLEDKYIFYECVFKNIAYFQTELPKYLKRVQENGLLSFVNFVGNVLGTGTDFISNFKCTSALLRQLILAEIKVNALILKGQKNQTNIIGRDLMCFWKDISCIISNTRNEPIKDWLPVVFADQDDQWVTSLFCLLIIYKELKNWHINKQQCENTSEGKAFTLESLQQTLCPHRFFHQLATFIDYDHLVLVDFLTSPETRFLSYFTQYMHFLRENWQGFLAACSKDNERFNKPNFSMAESKNCTLNKSSDNEVALWQSKDFTDFSISKFLPQIDFNKDSDRKSHSLSNDFESLLTPPTKKVFTLCKDASNNLEVFTDNCLNSTGVLHSFYKSQSSPSGNPLLNCLLSNDIQCPSTKYFDSLFRSQSIFQSTVPTSDSFYTSLSVVNNAVRNSPAEQSCKQNQCATESFTLDTNASICDTINSKQFLALVAYSDSDSDDCQENKSFDTITKKQILKRTLSLDLDSSPPADIVSLDSDTHTNIVSLDSDTHTKIVHINSDTHTKIVSLDSDIHTKIMSLDCDSHSDFGSHTLGNACQSPESDEESISSEHEILHENASDEIANDCINDIDKIMGMLIRLRLHIERLDANNLFPYKSKPLLFILEICEELYERPIQPL